MLRSQTAPELVHECWRVLVRRPSSAGHLRDVERPSAWGPTLYTDSVTKASRTKTVLNIKLFYWGIRKMIWRVLKARAAVGAASVEASSPIRGTATATPIATTITNVTSTAPDDFMGGGSPE